MFRQEHSTKDTAPIFSLNRFPSSVVTIPECSTDEISELRNSILRATMTKGTYYYVIPKLLKKENQGQTLGA